MEQGREKQMINITNKLLNVLASYCCGEKKSRIRGIGNKEQNLGFSLDKVATIVPVKLTFN